MAELNGAPGDPRSFDLLQRLLDAQAYRLAFWRVAGEEINYRRFFDVNALAAIRMEDPRVFAEAHRKVLGLLRDGLATGLRIDHPDGLYAPPPTSGGCRRPTWWSGARRLAAARGAALDEGTEALLLERIFAELEAGRLPPRPLYVVVEKVLVGQERMPEGWDVDGTTGYELLAAVNGLFVDPAAERALDALCARARRAARGLPRGGGREEAAGHVLVDGERGEHARAPALAHQRDRPAHPRLHPERAAPARWSSTWRSSPSTAPT